MLLQGITCATNAILKSRHFPEVKYLLWLSLVNSPAFPISPPKARGKAAFPCSLEIRSGHVTSSEYQLWMTWHASLLGGASVRLVGVPSLAVVIDGRGSISSIPGCEWQEQGVLPTWDGHGAQERNDLCYAKPLKFPGYYHCAILSVLIIYLLSLEKKIQVIS